MPPWSNRIGDYILEHAHIRERYRWIDCLDFAPDRRKQRSRVLLAPDYIDRGEVCALSEGNVHLRSGSDVQPEMAHITDNSYNRDPLRIARHSSHDNAFAQRILVRPEFLSERLINDDHQRRICV